MPATPGAANTINCSGNAACAVLTDACNLGVCSGGVCVSQTANEGGTCDDGISCTAPDTCSAGVCNGGLDACPSGQTCNRATNQCEATLLDPLPIDVGETWKLFKGTAEPAPGDLTSWTTIDYDDSAWLQGPSGFGYGADCTAQRGTLLSDMQNPPGSPGYTSVYLRKQFRVDNPARVLSLTLTVDYDDAFVAYINGTEVARSTTLGGTAGVPTAYNYALATSTNHECSACDTAGSCNAAQVIDLAAYRSLLVAGTNVIAVHGHNTTLASSDFTITPSLSAVQSSGCFYDSDCNDNNNCTDDHCDSDTGICSHVANDANPCSDGYACTTDHCSAGACVGTDACPVGTSCNHTTNVCESAPVTVSFQQGTGGYTGAVDTYIQASSATDNAAAVTLTADGIPPDTDQRQILLRFDNIFGTGTGQVPPGSTITSATLTVNVTNAIAIETRFHRMLRTWSASGVWATFGASPWNTTAGVQADGVEAVATPDVAPASIASTGLQTITVTPSLQAWANAPAANFGWVLMVSTADSLAFDSAEGATIASRPKLTVTYIAPAGTCGVDADCDDGLFCNGSETCDQVTFTCRPGTAFDCSDAIACTTDTCGEATFPPPTCGHVAVNTLCNDANACTDDVCDVLTGCQHYANSASCSDGNACTTGDTCAAGSCVGGAALNCDDGIACTADTCNAATGCAHTDACTGGLTCNTTTGVCQSGPVTATFQQRTAGYTGTVDTFLVKGTPDTGNAAATTLIVDGGPDADIREILLRFDGIFGTGAGQIPPGSTISSATLTINVTNISTTGAELFRMLTPWVDTATWNSVTGGIQTDGVEAASSYDATSTYNTLGLWTFDVTSSLAAWSAGATNYGWAWLSPPAGTDSWQFDSAEGTTPPKLTVVFTAPGPSVGARMKCALSRATIPASGTVSLDVLLEKLGTVPGIRGYQSQIAISRTAGAGTVGVACPGGVSIDENRPAYLFTGHTDDYPVANCNLLRAASALRSGSVALGATDAYLASYGLTVSADATVGSTFEISIAPSPAASLADEAGDPIEFEAGPACVLTIVAQECTTAAQCDDGNACTDDACSGNVCSHTNNTAPCSDGNVCTTTDQCSAGICVGGPALACDDANVCTTDGCDAGTGCTHAFNTNPCDDASACTTGDVCSNGACAGTAISCDDGNVCTDDSCSPATGCVHAANTAACSDGNACTSNDTCAAGTCGGTAVVCNDSVACTTDTCAPLVGCIYTDNCTNGQTCNLTSGTCTGGPVIDPLPIDVGEAWKYFKATVAPPADWAAIAFDDAAWLSGPSGFGYGPDCVSQHATVLSDMTSGPGYISLYLRKQFSVSNPAAIGALTFSVDYDDAFVVYLNGTEVARRNIGTVGTPPTYTTLATADHECSACASTTCNAAENIDITAYKSLLVTGTNVVAVQAHNLTLTSSDFTITPSLTTAALPSTLTFQDGAGGYTGTQDTYLYQSAPATVEGSALFWRWDTDDPSSSGLYEYGLIRFDGIFGSGAGQIPVGSQISSATLTLYVENGTVAPAGEVDPVLVDWDEATTTWNDFGGDAGVQADEYGTAVASAPLATGAVTVDVTASLAAWATDPAANRGWIFRPNSTDGAQVTSSEGATVANRPKLSVTYVAPTGECTTDPDCSDGDACNGTERCVDNTCRPGTAPVCDDGNVCTTDGCNAVSGCTHTNNTAPCNDGNACTTSDQCSAGFCAGGPALVCDDGNVCTTDGCDVATGCTHANNTNPCDDGSVCTTVDTCSNGSCAGSAPLDCNDGNVCTNDSCDASTGCTHTANTASCDDGSACTTGDVCSGGVCVGGPVDCSDGNDCTLDACDGGTCTHVASCSVGGTVRYYRDAGSSSEPSNKGTPGIGIDRTNDLFAETSTGPLGTYAFSGLAGDVWVRALDRFETTWASEARDAVSSFDASSIARYAVNAATFSPNQLIAGDVTGNGEVTSFDAAYVAQFSAQLITHLPVAVSRGSDWKLMRCDQYTSATDQNCGTAAFHHSPLAGPTTDDFYSILYGDVTGNYPVDSGLRGAGGEEAAARTADVLAAATLRGVDLTSMARAAGSGPAVLSARLLPAETGATTRQIALTLESSNGILGLDLDLRYAANRISIVGVEVAGIASNFQLVSNDVDGRLDLALYGVVPLQGSGPIVIVTFDTAPPVSAASVFEIGARANEGTIPVVITPPHGVNGRGVALDPLVTTGP